MSPFFILLAGCRTAPEPQPSTTAHESSTDSWDGSGGAPRMRNRGDALANFALGLRGTRYRYGGATLDGFDCSGLVFYTHRHFGLDVPRTSSEQAEEAEAVKRRRAQARRPGVLPHRQPQGQSRRHLHRPSPVRACARCRQAGDRRLARSRVLRGFIRFRGPLSGIDYRTDPACACVTRVMSNLPGAGNISVCVLRQRAQFDR